MENQLNQNYFPHSLSKFIYFFVILSLLLPGAVTAHAAAQEFVPSSRSVNGSGSPADTIHAVGDCETNLTLVGCWKMEEITAGGLLSDGSSAHANNATVVGSPVLGNGYAGKALVLDGRSQYASVTNHASLDLTTGLTLAAWIWPEIIADQALITKAALGSINGYELALGADNRAFFRINQADSADNYRVESTTKYKKNNRIEWTYVVATFDGISMHLYINGKHESKLGLLANTLIATNSLPLSIGAQADATRFFQGQIDEVRVYNVALNDNQVWNMFVGSPTAVTMNSFSAGKSPAGVQLTWETVSDTSTAGFNLYRQDPSGGFVLVNETLIPTQLGGPMGSTYTYLDTGAVPGQRYVYRLEVLDTSLNVSSSTLLTYWPFTVLLPLLGR